MRYGLRKYLVFAKAGIQSTIAYRGQVVLWTFGTLLNAVMLGLLWWTVYKFSDADAIGGYTFPQMLLYVLLTGAVSQTIYSETMSELTWDVHKGLIGMRLMKPIDYRTQLGFTAFGSFAARTFIVCIPMTLASTLVAVFAFGLTGIQWYNVLLFLPLCLLSALTFDAFSFLFGQLAFRTHAMFGVSSMSEIISSFLSGALVPISLFPTWAQTVLAYTPFPTMISLPVRTFLGLMSWSELGIAAAIAIAWIVALNLIAHLLYKASVRHVVVFGG